VGDGATAEFSLGPGFGIAAGDSIELVEQFNTVGERDHTGISHVELKAGRRERPLGIATNYCALRKWAFASDKA
jgi:hypothetical protein